MNDTIGFNDDQRDVQEGAAGFKFQDAGFRMQETGAVCFLHADNRNML